MDYSLRDCKLSDECEPLFPMTHLTDNPGWLAGCLMQLVSNTKVNPSYNHCLFSLSVTKVTTLPLKQPISFYSVHIVLFTHCQSLPYVLSTQYYTETDDIV